MPHTGREEDIVVVQVGTLDDTSTLESVPSVELNVKHRLTWVRGVEGAEQKETYT